MAGMVRKARTVRKADPLPKYQSIGVLERFDQENLICFSILRASVLYKIECEADLFELMAKL